MRTVVVGIGNRERGDDGVGPLVIDELRRRGVDVELVADDPARLYDHIQGVDLAIVVDACVCGEAVGSVRVLDEVPAELAASSHGISVASAFEMAALLGNAPRVSRFVLIEGREFELGSAMSPAVVVAIPLAADKVEGLLASSLVPDRGTPKRYRLQVRGKVQGVGFRPFAYCLAREMGLTGYVLNGAHGALVEIEGSAGTLDRFVARLKAELPPPGAILALDQTVLEPAGYGRFEIRESDEEGRPSVEVLPDLAVCENCLREMRDPGDRRYRYPFLSCTHCGPRYSVIESLPYDRPAISMRIFPMCEACGSEYRNPLNRRFHAQTIACPECGPHVELWDSDGQTLARRDEAILAAAQVVIDGGILAVKGQGGFRLHCDARREESVLALRERKSREFKPFAVMVHDLSQALAIADPSPAEVELLRSRAAPIVLTQGRRSLAPNVAPGLKTLGVMLPGSPLDHLLMEAIGFPVVATSGNLSEEPICIDEKLAVGVFHGIADALLVHDQPIVRPIDDSVVRVMDGRPIVLRRARGYAPTPHVEVGIEPGWVGVGAHMKGSVAISVEGSVITGQHIGNLEGLQTRRRLESEYRDLLGLYEGEPRQVVHDLHPDYASTHFAEHLNLPCQAIQHHVAHAAACIAENDLREPVLAVVWDGTGLGPDGTIWGGEFLLVDGSTVRRVAALREFNLVGGDLAARDGRRSAVGLLNAAYGEVWPEPAEFWFAEAFDNDLALGSMVRRLSLDGRGFVTTSAGRLFDAFASLSGLHHSRFEGDAAMRFEALAGESRVKSAVGRMGWKPMPQLRLDWSPMLEWASKGGDAAFGVHAALADGICQIAQEIGVKAVALTGGCFQNALLYELTCDQLRASGFRPYDHQQIPPNDEGIAFGQVIAASRGWRLEPCA